MPKVLTPLSVKQMKPRAIRREICDGGARNLYLVVQKTGSKSWMMLIRRPNGKAGKLALGPVDLSGEEAVGAPVIGAPLTLAGARWLAADLQRRRALGEDIVADHRARKHRQREEINERDATSFETCAREFLTTHTTKKHGTRPRRLRETAALLGFDYLKEGEPMIVKKGLADRWKERDVRQIDEHDIWSVVKEAREDGVPGRGRRNKGASAARARAMFAALSVFFRWLRRERLISANPCAGLEPPSPPAARQRALAPDEIRWFWLACDAADAGGMKVFAPMLRVLALTGCRLNEVAGMTRKELAGGTSWTIPGARTKNHLEFLLPLSALASEVIASTAGLEGKPDFVFTTTGTSPVSGFAKMKKRLDAAMVKIARAECGPEFTIPPWRLHDLRRTCATGMAGIGVLPHIVEACLNHISGAKAGVAGTYNVEQYHDEKHDAFQRWARWIALVIDRELYAAHQRLLDQGNDEARRKAKRSFIDAISEGGPRWKRYVTALAKGGADNVVNLRQPKAVPVPA